MWRRIRGNSEMKGKKGQGIKKNKISYDEMVKNKSLGEFDEEKIKCISCKKFISKKNKSKICEQCLNDRWG